MLSFRRLKLGHVAGGWREAVGNCINEERKSFTTFTTLNPIRCSRTSNHFSSPMLSYPTRHRSGMSSHKIAPSRSLPSENTKRHFFGYFNSSNPITDALMQEEGSKEITRINYANIKADHFVAAVAELQERYDNDLKLLEGMIQEDQSLPYDQVVPKLEEISRPLVILQNIIELYVTVKKDPSLFESAHEANSMVQLSHKYSTIIRDKLLEIERSLDDDKDEEAKRVVAHLLRQQRLNGTYNLNNDDIANDPSAMQDQIKDIEDRLGKVRYKFLKKSALTMEENGQAASPQELLQMMYELVALQQHLAKVLGFESLGAYSLEKHNTIVKDVNEITRLHEEFSKDTVATFSSDEFQSQFLDLVSKESSFVNMKDYLELESVMKGLFDLSKKLFGIEIVEDEKGANGWHRDVRLFHIYEEGVINEEAIGSFYFDPYQRLQKDMGCFAMSIEHIRKPSSKPLIAISMDINPPMWEDSVQTMDVQNVTNLFHEFGHSLQHLLGDVKLGAYSGAQLIEEDASEVISQFMEYWLFEGGMLQSISSHIESGEPLPLEAVNLIQQQRKATKANELLHRLFLGQLEVELNTTFDPHGDDSIISLQRKLAEKYCPHHLPPKGNIDPLIQIFQSNASGRSTQQYRYLFSELISADAFDAFLDNDGQILEDKVLRSRGMEFRKHFLNGGSKRSTIDAFKQFRGRQMNSTALLSRYDL